MRIQSLANKPHAIITLAALCLTLAVGIAAFWVMRGYQRARPIWVEQAAYGQWPMVKFQSIIREHGLLTAIRESLTTDDILINRHLLQLWVLGLFAPRALGWFHAPLLIVMPMFAVFLSLLGWTVYNRSSNLFYSVASMMLFCVLAQLTSHNWGVGSGFADWQSMFLLSSAAMCLINAFAALSLNWVRAFAVFLALAVLSRITVAFYAFIICGPILLIYLLTLYKKERSAKQIAQMVLTIVLLLSPVIILMFTRLTQLLVYYGSTNAWNLNHSLQESAANIFIVLLKPFVGWVVVLFCLVVLGVNMLGIMPHRQFGAWVCSALTVAGVFLVLLPMIATVIDLVDLNLGEWRQYSLIGGTSLLLSAYDLKSKKTTDQPLNSNIQPESRVSAQTLAIVWWGIGFLLFLLIKGYTSDVPKEAMYAIPPTLLICFAPFSKRSFQSVSQNYLAGFIVFCSAVSFVWFAVQNARLAVETTPAQKSLRQVQYGMAEVLSEFPEGSSWQSYTSMDWGIPVSLLTQYEYEKFQDSRGSYFYNRKAYWDTWYPGLTLNQLQEKLYMQTIDCVDIALVLMDYSEKPDGMEDYSYSIAAFISERIQSSDEWQYLDQVNGWPAGIQYGFFYNTEAVHSDKCIK
jgi:hypothetical protein